jgi:hypothetical protein
LRQFQEIPFWARIRRIGSKSSEIDSGSIGSSVSLIRLVNFEDFYMAVAVILPVFDGKFSANVDVNRATGVIRLGIIRMCAGFTSNCHEAIS